MPLRPLLLACAPACALLLACSAGEVASTGGATTDLTTTTGASTGGASSSGAPTTGEPATTTTTTTTTGDGTTDAPTSTSGEPGTGSSGGPICDPGTANCVCDAGTCTGDLLCVDDVCVSALTCDGDVDEPDDDEPVAHDLGEITDDDSMTLAADGVLTGLGDRDYFTYHALDTVLHTAEPTVKLTTAGDLRLCQFLECDSGGVAFTQLTCPQGTQDALSGELRPGCCGGPVFTISDFNCDGSSDDVQVYVRLDKSAEDVCVEYSLSLHN